MPRWLTIAFLLGGLALLGYDEYRIRTSVVAPTSGPMYDDGFPMPSPPPKP